MLTKQQRQELIDNAPKTGDSKTILYKGDSLPLEVYEVPLRALLYNRYNGRIKSRTLSYESTFDKLNPENHNDKIIIEQFLYDSAINRNEKTIESLLKIGQQEFGIITKDGVIIDGNRRAMLLNKINKEHNLDLKFKTLILPDNLENDARDITLLETNYQMGVDSKVEYNAIEKYLRCSELKNQFNIDELSIAELMAEETKTIYEWLNIFVLMNEYLDHLKTPQVYTQLEKKEGHFVDLNNYLKAYKKRAESPPSLEDIKRVYFDYIRLGIPVQRARIIAKSTPNSSFFTHPEIWPAFYEEHKKIVHIAPQLSLEKLKAHHPEESNESLIRTIDREWKETIGNDLLENLSFHETLIKDFTEKLAPIKLLRRIEANLTQVKSFDFDKHTTTEGMTLLLKIEGLTSEIKEKIASQK